MKRVMVVGGGAWQVPIIRKAKEMGAFVVCSNRDRGSPGFEYADIGLVADVLDKKTNLQYAETHRVDAVITDQSDIAVETVAHIASMLGLAGIGNEAATLFTNKHQMRTFCSSHGFPTPDYRLCEKLDDAYDFVHATGLPTVVKPPANQSSRGVTKVTSLAGLEKAYRMALDHSRDGTVLLEEFVGGVELTVDGVKLNGGGHFSLVTSSKSHYEHNEMVANQLWFGQSHPCIDYEEMHVQHDRLISAMSLPFGLTHAEYKYHEGQFFLIEVAARGGGTRLSSDIVPLMSGIDSNELLIRMALGEQVGAIRPVPRAGFAVLDFLQFEPGRVRSVTGLEEAAAIDGVVALGVDIRPNDIVREATDDRSRHGYVIACRDNENDLRSLLRRIRQVIRLEYE